MIHVFDIDLLQQQHLLHEVLPVGFEPGDVNAGRKPGCIKLYLVVFAGIRLSIERGCNLALLVNQYAFDLAMNKKAPTLAGAISLVAHSFYFNISGFGSEYCPADRR
jgi:hypothetical protein